MSEAAECWLQWGPMAVLQMSDAIAPCMHSQPHFDVPNISQILYKHLAMLSSRFWLVLRVVA